MAREAARGGCLPQGVCKPLVLLLGTFLPAETAGVWVASPLSFGGASGLLPSPVQDLPPGVPWSDRSRTGRDGCALPSVCRRGGVSEMEELIRSPARGSRADGSLAPGAEAGEEAQECRQGHPPSLAFGPLILGEVHAWPPGGSAPSSPLPVGGGCSGAAGRCSPPPRAPASVSRWPCLFPLELQVSA